MAQSVVHGTSDLEVHGIIDRLQNGPFLFTGTNFHRKMYWSTVCSGRLKLKKSLQFDNAYQTQLIRLTSSFSEKLPCQLVLQSIGDPIKSSRMSFSSAHQRWETVRE